MANALENLNLELSEISEAETSLKNEDVIEEDNAFAYLNRADFSSEKFKIEIKNLPKIYGINEFKKLLNIKLKLNCTKIKAPKRNSSYAFVCFRNEDDRSGAIKTITGYKWKGKLLQAIKAKPSPDPLVRKRKQSSMADQDGTKKGKLDDRSQEIKLKESTIPLADVPYVEQLQIKQEEVKKTLKQLACNLNHQNIELSKWLETQKQLYDGLPCQLLEIRHAQHYDGYRNKCEFSVGVSGGTKAPTVGFRIGSYANGITEVGSIETLRHIPETMVRAVNYFQNYVRSSKLEVYNYELHTGHFRQLMVRCAKDHLMLVVGIHPQQLSQEELSKLKADLVDYFTNREGKDARITSLYYQTIMKKTSNNDIQATEHLWGETHIFETLLGLKFRISPEAFFQVNTDGAEVLYKSIIDLAEAADDSTILDVCCGTGTIGLCFANNCAKVLGIDVIPQAIVDAKENAKLNGVSNSEFFTGKAEETLGSVCYKAIGNVIAIVDPPRAGLQQKAVQQLRKVKKINKLVYVACNPKAALKNFVDLGRPVSKTLHNEPFVPVKAVAVDMFPHTKHCELIVCFERYDKVMEKHQLST